MLTANNRTDNNTQCCIVNCTDDGTVDLAHLYGTDDGTVDLCLQFRTDLRFLPHVLRLHGSVGWTGSLCHLQVEIQ